MTFHDSRLGPGTLKFATVEYGFQATNVRLVPTVEEIDGTPTLATPTPEPDTQDAKWTLEGTVIQDWESPTGFVEYCRDNNGSAVAFEWVPNTSTGLTLSGTCTIKALEIGGDIAAQTTADFSFRLTGQPTRVDV